LVTASIIRKYGGALAGLSIKKNGGVVQIVKGDPGHEIYDLPEVCQRGGHVGFTSGGRHTE